jgi:hypothetical protein
MNAFLAHLEVYSTASMHSASGFANDASTYLDASTLIDGELQLKLCRTLLILFSWFMWLKNIINKVMPTSGVRHGK